MKKYLSLIKASMSEGMNIFKINTKKKSTFTKIVLPIFLVLALMGSMFGYSEILMEQLTKIKMEFVLLTIFIVVTSLMTVIEGIYKSGSLLFNCKDDDLLLSLPISKGTVLFIRIFKFYVFELIFNSIFLLPSMALYAKYTIPGIMYYIISLIGLLLFPIVPIILSSLIGFAITLISSKFKGKNMAQTILVMIFLLGVMYFSYNSDSLVLNLAKKASSINDLITKIYYPAGAYIELITNFDALKLLEFIAVHLGILLVGTVLLGRVYFNINSSAKSVKVGKKSKNYRIKATSQTKALIKKELRRFINSTVFVTNAGFGMVLFVVGCVLLSIKLETVIGTMTNGAASINIESIKNNMSIILLGFISFASFMTSITSSMISLEGKSFNILKSLPLKPYTIVRAKILTAILVMIPLMLIGDIVVFISFGFKVSSMLLIIALSVLLPLVSETFGILINLRYPKMDAKNDTEVVKQSMSSTICVFSGIGLSGITAFLLYKAVNIGFAENIILLISMLVFSIIFAVLYLILRKTCDKSFNDIVA